MELIERYLKLINDPGANYLVLEEISATVCQRYFHESRNLLHKHLSKSVEYLRREFYNPTLEPKELNIYLVEDIATLIGARLMKFNYGSRPPLGLIEYDSSPKVNIIATYRSNVAMFKMILGVLYPGQHLIRYVKRGEVFTEVPKTTSRSNLYSIVFFIPITGGN